MRDIRDMQPSICDAIGGVEVPAVNLARIRAKMSEPKARPRTSYVWAALAAAGLAVALLVTPAGAMQGIGARFNAALRAIGVMPPPRPPAKIIRTLLALTHRVDIAQARKQVAFALVAPSGLPRGVTLQSIVIGTPASFSARTHGWALNAQYVQFNYRRAPGGEFSIMAQRYDPTRRLSAYMWEPLEDASGNPVIRSGRPVLLRHDWLHWRNGNQLMDAITSGAITAREIAAVRDAMHGVPLAAYKSKGPHPNGKFLVVKKP